MKAYGLSRDDTTQLEWWSGSKSRTGNKTSSDLKRRSRRTYKKIGRAKLKAELQKLKEEK